MATFKIMFVFQSGFFGNILLYVGYINRWWMLKEELGLLHKLVMLLSNPSIPETYKRKNNVGKQTYETNDRRVNSQSFFE